jgi:hypothetical protein
MESTAMKRLIKDLGAQLSAAVLIAATGAAQNNPAPPIDDGAAAGTGGFGMVAGAGGVAGGMAPFSDVRVVNAGAGIPVGGGLLIYAGGMGIAPIVQVSDATTPTTTLGGTLTALDGELYWVWEPTSPLTAGSTYEVRLSTPDFGVRTSTFDVVATITIARPAIESSPSASWRGETNNWSCCRTLIGGTLEDASCFPSEQRASIMLEPGFTTSDPAVLLNQFVFRLGTDELSADLTGPSIWPNVYVSPLYTQAEEYCFTLEAIEIISGTVHTYEDIERCAPHGELKDLGFLPIEPGSVELDRVVCHAPPDQFKDQWCDINEDPCAHDNNETGCGLYGFVCEGEPLPPDPFSMMAGFGGMSGFAGMGGFGAIGGAGSAAIGGSTSGGTGGASGMSDGSDAGADDDDGKSSGGGNSGCSVSGARGASGSSSAFGYAFSAAAALAWLSRRRKRSA